MEKVRVGIIGGGFIGKIHTEALRRLGYVEVVALAEANQEIADRIAGEMSIPTAYGDYHDLINNSDIDSVHVLTPNRFHYPMSRDALEAGKHVLTEKPLAMSTDESADLLKVAENAGVLHCLCHNMRYYPLVKQAREMVKAGEVGDIRLIHGQYLQDWLFFETDYNWRLHADEGGVSRAVADIGTHWLDMVQHVSGQKVASVFADLSVFIPVRKKPKKVVETFSVQKLGPEDYEDVKIDTEDHGTVLMKFSGGAKGVLVACQVCAGRKNHIHFEINGTRCSLEWCGERPDEMWIGRRGEVNGEFMKNPVIMAPDAARYAGSPAGLGEGYLDTFKNVFGDFYCWVREGRSMNTAEAPFPTYLTGHEELCIVDAVLKSRDSGKWEEVKY
jgi:predicted dehydrogenase